MGLVIMTSVQAELDQHRRAEHVVQRLARDLRRQPRAGAHHTRWARSCVAERRNAVRGRDGHRRECLCEQRHDAERGERGAYQGVWREPLRQ